MKKLIAVLLSFSLLLTGCKADVAENSANSSDISENTNNSASEMTSSDVDMSSAASTDPEIAETDWLEDEDLVFTELDEEGLRNYLAEKIYSDLIDNLDSNYFVEDIDTMYYSKEYIEELAYNSKENIFFGFTSAQIEEVFQDEAYIFTLAEDGKTIVIPFEPYDDTYDKVLRNVLIGTGVIVLCVAVSVATAGAGAPAAVSAVFAVSAKSAAIAALSEGVISAAMEGIIKGVETGDMDEALKAAALAGSEGYKWGAIGGSVTGAISETAFLKIAASKGLTMSEAAIIQKESKLPAKLIREFDSMESYTAFKNNIAANGMTLKQAADIAIKGKYPLKVVEYMRSADEYKIYKGAGLTSNTVNGSEALVREIDLKYVDELGRTNLQRMEQGLAALDKNGTPYELHHIGQRINSPLAILTKTEHIQGGNNKILHPEGAGIEHGNVWSTQKSNFWKALAKVPN